MKRLPLHRRPYFAKTILEIGGGHDPYHGTTHAVDKFPGDNTQRGGDFKVLKNVEFRKGDLEEIPFDLEKKFDFLYASHVLEHVENAQKAVSEINRVSRRGYIATPTPLREQLGCPIPYDAVKDFHTYYCWTGDQANTIHMIKKTAAHLGKFCDCVNGKKASYLFHLKNDLHQELESLMPRGSKETALYYQSPIQLHLHIDFQEACENGFCAFTCMRSLDFWASFPAYLVFKRFKKLRSIMKEA